MQASSKTVGPRQKLYINYTNTFIVCIKVKFETIPGSSLHHLTKHRIPLLIAHYSDLFKMAKCTRKRRDARVETGCTLSMSLRKNWCKWTALATYFKINKVHTYTWKLLFHCELMYFNWQTEKLKLFDSPEIWWATCVAYLIFQYIVFVCVKFYHHTACEIHNML